MFLIPTLDFTGKVGELLIFQLFHFIRLKKDLNHTMFSLFLGSSRFISLLAIMIQNTAEDMWRFCPPETTTPFQVGMNETRQV